MTDVEAIQKTISTYSEGGSRQKWDQLLSMFTPDATWELAGRGLHIKGHAEMREGFPKLVEGTDFLVQMNAPAIIDVDGDRATARSIIREAGKVKDRDEWIDILGTYEDRLIRTPQGWRFTHRTFTVIGVGRMPFLPNPELPL